MKMKNTHPADANKVLIWGTLFAILILAFALRFFSANLWLTFLSTATVLGVFLMVREMMRSNLAGLVSAYLLTFSYWAINFSNIGINAVVIPLILSFSAYLIFKGIRTKKLHDFIFAGIIFGLGMHTYLTFQVVPLLLLALFASFFITRKNFTQEHWKHVLVFAFAAIVTAIPELFYFLSLHPQAFDLQTIQTSALYNDHYPTLSPITGLAFLIGLIYLAMKFLQLFWLRLHHNFFNEKLSGYFFLTIWAITIFIPINTSLYQKSILPSAITSLPAIFAIASIPFSLLIKKTEKFGFSFKVAVFSIILLSFVFVGIFDTIKYMSLFK